jgi:hypothetical protein
MKKITWYDVWMSFLLILTISLLTLIGMCIFNDSKIDRYLLRTTTNTETGIKFMIEEKRIWGNDHYIELPKDISLDKTLNVIDSLNLSLKK